MKRILIFSLAYYPKFIGGAEIAVKQITDRINACDITFHMITLRYDSTLPKVSQEGNILVHRIGIARKGTEIEHTFHPLWYINKILFVPLSFFKALSLNRTYHYNGLWALMSYMLFPIVLLRMVGMCPPYILTLQDGDPFDRVYGRARIVIFKSLLMYGFRHAAVVQTISAFLSTWARGWGFTGPLEVIPNGVDIEHFSKVYNEKELSELKIQLSKKPGNIYLITTSRLIHKNAVDTIIEALSELPTHIQLLVLGTGPDAQSLRRLATLKGVEHRIQWFGYIDHKDMPRYLNVSDIFIRPSRTEGMGNSFIEAMAAGLPVIATQEGGIADFLFDPIRNPNKPSTGWAIDVDNPLQIVEAVEYILANPQEVSERVENAKNLVREKYNWSDIARNMREHVFEHI